MMRPLRVLATIGQMLHLFGWTFLVPIPIAFLYEPGDVILGPLRLPHNALVFLAAFAVSMTTWFILHMASREEDVADLQEREAYLAVAIGWLVATVLAAVPFLLSREMTSPIDAFFEAMSGLTTTGATAFAGRVEDVAASVLFWRALMQWVGGLGIIVLVIAVISSLTQGGLALFQAEASGHIASRTHPKLVQTARALWRVYLVVSLGMVIVLLLLLLRTGLPFKEAVFDAIYHSFTAYATGGFSSRSGSVGFYGDVYVEMAVVVFMIVGATNFTLLLHLRHGRFRQFLRDPQWRLLMGIFGAATVATVALLARDGTPVPTALRGAVFSVTTTLTGTGLTNVDYTPWPAATHLILLLLMLMGGNAGSTSGAIKSIRFVVLAKVFQREVRRLLHPRAVLPIRVGNRVLDEATLGNVTAFVFTYLLVWVAGTLAVVAIDPALDIVDGASATASTLGNVGVGLGAVGPVGSYATLLPATKVILAFLMWFGRLELFTALLVFSRQAWKN